LYFEIGGIFFVIQVEVQEVGQIKVEVHLESRQGKRKRRTSKLNEHVERKRMKKKNKKKPKKNKKKPKKKTKESKRRTNKNKRKGRKEC